MWWPVLSLKYPRVVPLNIVVYLTSGTYCRYSLYWVVGTYRHPLHCRLWVWPFPSFTHWLAPMVVAVVETATLFTTSPFFIHSLVFTYEQLTHGWFSRSYSSGPHLIRGKECPWKWQESMVDRWTTVQHASCDNSNLLPSFFQRIKWRPLVFGNFYYKTC